MKLKFIEKRRRRRFARKEAQRLFADRRVRNGPFSGLLYPDFRSEGSAMFPKFLGSYESELHPLIERCIATDYSEIVDVGCAEGYYAVGMALRMPEARIFAYDTSEHSRSLCEQMAQLNGVAERVEIGSHCDPQTLMQLDLTRRALIISDCEGYEKTLFSPEVVAALGAHDVLIETHDLFDISISAELRKRFSKTHSLEVVTSVDDLQKAIYYDYSELAPYDPEQRKKLLAERRHSIMEWFFFTPVAATPPEPERAALKPVTTLPRPASHKFVAPQ